MMFNKKKFEQSAALKTAAERGSLLGHGSFWKRGSGFKSWKERRYEIYQNAYLIYIDVSGSNTVVKGALRLEDIFVKNGKEDNVFHCGNPSAATAAKRRALTVESFSENPTDTRVFETVFNSVDDLMRFLNTMMLSSPKNNIVEYCATEGLKLNCTTQPRTISMSFTSDQVASSASTDERQPAIPARVRPTVNRDGHLSPTGGITPAAGLASPSMDMNEVISPGGISTNVSSVSTASSADSDNSQFRQRAPSISGVKMAISTEQCNALIARIRQSIDSKRVAEVFATIDADKSNSIDKNEMEAAWNILNIKLTADEIDSIFQRFDSDQSGHLDYQEFLNLIGSDKHTVQLPEFGLDFSDTKLASFSCAIHASKGLSFVHGRLIITEFFLAFEGWPTTRLLLPLATITGVDKVSTMKIFPNALLIKCSDGEEYFFGSFANRNGCYSFLKLKIGEASRWKSDNPTKLPWMSRNLVFGWQADAMNLSGKASLNSESTTESPTDATDDNDDDDEDEDNAATVPAKIDTPDEPQDDVDMDTLFLRSTVAPLLAETVLVPGDDVFNAMWKSSKSFMDFLTGEGDSSVQCGEWVPLSGASVAEDISKLPFQFSRQCSYVHPQKKTAFVAATNAKVSQMQYLYLYGRGSGTAANVDASRPRRGMVLTVSQFEGIPFSDYFKVLAYYGFDDVGGGDKDASSCTIRFGAAVHFVKSTMLKGQIQSGVVGELGDFAKHYYAFVKHLSNPAQPPKKSKKGTMTRVKIDAPNEANDGVMMESLFEKCSISGLLSQPASFPGDDLFEFFWRSSNGFKDFLTGEGDSSVQCGEWAPLSGASVAEDISKLPFQFSRQCSYVHPQKKTAFVAATNAKVSQMQYLYLYGRGSGTAANVDASRPRRGMVLTVSQFEGIPFSDYFKVLAYYGFDEVGGGDKDASSCTIRFGAAVHFVKSTMLKGQIQSGVVGELGDFAKHYYAFAKKRTEMGIAEATGGTVTEAPEQAGPGPTAGVSAAGGVGAGGAESGVSALVGNASSLIVMGGIIILLVLLVILQWRSNNILMSTLSDTNQRLSRVEELLARQTSLLGALTSGASSQCSST